MKDMIEFLVEETIRHHQENFFECLEDEARVNTQEEGPGLIYVADVKSSTFVIRALVSQDLAKDKENIELKPAHYPELRWDGEQQILCYPCDLKIADTIMKSFSNQRFPLNEEDVFNLSDPGFSWWYEKEGNKVRIYFSLRKFPHENMIKLGPLSSYEQTSRVLKYASKFFNEILHINDFYLDSTGMGFTLPEDSELCEQIHRLFQDGLIEQALEDKLRDIYYAPEQRLTGQFFYQLGHLRKFWIQANQKLNE